VSPGSETKPLSPSAYERVRDTWVFDARVGKIGLDLGGLDNLIVRHVKVEQGDVGLEVASPVDSVGKVHGLANNVDRGFLCQDSSNGTADQFGVVGDENGARHGLDGLDSRIVAATFASEDGMTRAAESYCFLDTYGLWTPASYGHLRGRLKAIRGKESA
jgi:hypothetical protein